MRVLWSERARRDVARIRDYLLERNPLAAVAVAESLIAAGTALSQLPRRYPERGEGYREMVVSRYHYIVRYELMPDPEYPNRTAVGVLSVWHPAQDRE
ncbi:MAG: type II toxin-antitoxin system RelE/ParE family toxin [Magnetospirillum sp. WYHS-4]